MGRHGPTGRLGAVALAAAVLAAPGSESKLTNVGAITRTTLLAAAAFDVRGIRATDLPYHSVVSVLDDPIIRPAPRPMQLASFVEAVADPVLRQEGAELPAALTRPTPFGAHEGGLQVAAPLPSGPPLAAAATIRKEMVAPSSPSPAASLPPRFDVVAAGRDVADAAMPAVEGAAAAAVAAQAAAAANFAAARAVSAAGQATSAALEAAARAPLVQPGAPPPLTDQMPPQPQAPQGWAAAAASATAGHAPAIFHYAAGLSLASVIKVVCMVGNVIVQVSPYPDVRRWEDRGCTGDADSASYVSIAFGGSQWCFYGTFAWLLTRRSGFLVLVQSNFLGAMLGAYYVLAFHRNCRCADASDALRRYLLTAASLALLQVLGMLVLPLERALFLVGLISSFCGFAGSLSMLNTVPKVLKKRDSSSIPGSFAVANFFGALSWVVCGWVLGDPLVTGPNVAAASSSAVCIYLKLRFPAGGAKGGRAPGKEPPADAPHAAATESTPLMDRAVRALESRNAAVRASSRRRQAAVRASSASVPRQTAPPTPTAQRRRVAGTTATPLVMSRAPAGGGAGALLPESPAGHDEPAWVDTDPAFSDEDVQELADDQHGRPPSEKDDAAEPVVATASLREGSAATDGGTGSGGTGST